MAESAANSAVLVVRLFRRRQPEFFAFTFGFGRFLLRSDGYERSFGLRVALNTLYEGDDPTATEAPVRVRRVDAKTVDANTMLSRQQANRLASFDAGSVSADLLLMSPQYQERATKAIKDAAKAKGVEAAPFLGFGLDSVTPGRHEIVYGIIEHWRGRSLVDALPFFSKVNLRRHREELRRMGFPVSYCKIEVAPAPAARRTTARSRRRSQAASARAAHAATS